MGPSCSQCEGCLYGDLVVKLNAEVQLYILVRLVEQMKDKVGRDWATEVLRLNLTVFPRPQ